MITERFTTMKSFPCEYLQSGIYTVAAVWLLSSAAKKHAEAQKYAAEVKNVCTVAVLAATHYVFKMGQITQSLIFLTPVY